MKRGLMCGARTHTAGL
ncbi:hypothetical protein KIPB_013201, partial [Kipferlia bialata]|eukprot:g13201.t1